MTTGLRKVLRALGISAGALAVLLAAAFLLVLFDKPLIRRVSQNFLSAKTGVAFKIGKLDYTLFPLHVVAARVTASYKASVFTVTASVARLEVRGDLKRLLGGTMPALESVDANIAEIRFDQTKVSEEPIDFAAVIPELGDILAYARRTSLNCRLTSLTVPGRRVEIESLALALSRAAPASGRAFDIRLDSGALRAATEDGRLALDTRLHASGTLTLASAAALDLRLSLADLQASSAGKSIRLPGLSLSAAGTWDTKAAAISLSRVDLGVPGLLDAAATANAGLGKDPSFDTAGKVRLRDLESLSVLARPFLSAAFRDARLGGEMLLQGRYTRPPRSAGRPAAVDGSIDMRRVALSYPSAPGPFDVELKGIVKVAGSLPDVTAWADITSTVGPISRGDVAVGSGEIHLEAHGGRAAAEITRLDASLRGLSTPLAGRGEVSLGAVTFTASGRADFAAWTAEIFRLDGSFRAVSAGHAGAKMVALGDVNVAGAASLDLVRRAAIIPGIELRLANLAPIRLSGRYDPSPGGAKAVRIESKGVSLAPLRVLLAPLLPPSLAGWNMEASADFALDASSVPRRRPSSTSPPSSAPDTWTFTGSLTFASAKFNDPAFTIAGDGLKPRLDIRGAYDVGASALDFTGSLAVAEGESLWKSFYVSWAKFPLRAEFGGRLLLPSRTFADLSAKFILPGLGELHAKGAASLRPAVSGGFRLGGRLGLEPLNSLFAQAGVAARSGLRLAGEIGADLALVKGHDGLAIDGRVMIDDASMEDPASRSSLAGLSATIPVQLLLAPARESAGALAGETIKPALPPSLATGYPAPSARQPAGAGSTEDIGTLKIGRIATALLTIEPPALMIVSRLNAWRLEPFSLDLFGSRFEFGALSLDFDPCAGTFRGAASLRPVEIDLARLPFASPSLPLTGKARLDFPSLEISRSRISVAGRADVDIFGGRVVVRDITVADPLAASRAVSCDIDLLDLDLKKITDVIPFGEMTGIIRGQVRGLSISYGQPEGFVLNIESVPRRGVAQTFSLKAVNNLTVISSGQQATAGGGAFWMRFIRGFRYAKIGIVSTLKNDAFTLNGTIHDKGIEYLVKKPPLFGINVINRMPDKKIGFKEMMGRLRSIESSRPPVVKSKIR